MSKVLVAVILAGVAAQFAKLVALLFKHKHLKWNDIVVTGGMPSSHSAFVISLLTIIFLTEGVSTAFVISLVLAAVVIRDAFGVRRTAGEEGMVINQIMTKLKMKKETHFSMGHTPAQVVVGAMIGFAIAILVYFI
ncbi:MAG: divergent PAP2 family protein [archaeon]|nr:divergent PAP2 family protein [Nanoarchaeota archaeon]